MLIGPLKYPIGERELCASRLLPSILLVTFMAEEKKSCDLCGLPVEVEGFTLLTKEGKKEFCCEGCQGIYQMLNEDNLLPEEASK